MIIKFVSRCAHATRNADCYCVKGRLVILVAFLLVASATYVSPILAQAPQELLPHTIRNFSYGVGVAIDGDVAIVAGSTNQHPAISLEVPTIDVYRFNGTDWQFEQQLFSSDPVFRRLLGQSIEVDGDLITVGAPATARGGVVTFRYNGTTWLEESILQANSPTALTDDVGIVISQSGDIIVATDTKDWNGFVERELSYLFRYDGSAWLLEDTLRASDAYNNSGYGISASSASNLAVIGDPFFSVGFPVVTREGAAYIYEYAAGSWTETEKLTAGAWTIPNARFGQSTETDGNSIIVGAVRDSVGAIHEAGAAYVFTKQSGDWTLAQRLTASDGERQDYFGFDSKVQGDNLIIGAPNDFRPNFVNKGGYAYFFRFNGSQWIEHSKLSLPNPVTDDRFGWSVDMDGDWVIIGAPGRRQGNWRPGSAYIYPRGTLVSTEDTPSEAAIGDEISSVYPESVFRIDKPIVLDCRNWIRCARSIRHHRPQSRNCVRGRVTVRQSRTSVGRYWRSRRPIFRPTQHGVWSDSQESGKHRPQLGL